MSSKVLIVFIVFLTHGFNAAENAEYTCKANAVSEEAETIRLYWYCDKLIGDQVFKVIIKPADVEPLNTFDLFVTIAELNPEKSYEFTVILIQNTVWIPIAYTRGSALPKGELPERLPIHSMKEKMEYSHKLTVISECPYTMLVQWKLIRQLSTWNYRFMLITTPAQVPQIITDEMSIEISSLQPDTIYTFQLMVIFNDGTEMTAAEDARGRTFNADSPLATNLNAMVVSSNRIDLQWTAAKAASLQTNTYQVQCISDDRISFNVNETKVSIQNLLPMTAYKFRVQSKLTDGTFYGFSAYVEATTWSRDDLWILAYAWSKNKDKNV